MKVISIVGAKNSGKTSLIVDLIAYLKDYGKVGSIKHAHELDIDTSKDAERFFNAGADVAIGASGEKTLKICGSKDLNELIADMANSGVDFLLVEGFKGSDLPKIALNKNNFSNDEVSNIILSIDYKGTDKTLKEIAQLIRSLNDY